MTIENKLVPKGAMQLIDKGCCAETVFVKDAEGNETSKMNMTVYSGGVIKNHWYWDDLVIDLEGGKFSKPKYPVLEDHDTSRKIAFSGKPIVIDGKLNLSPDNTVFVDTDVSKEFQTLSKQGFPFQSSLRGKPTRVERIEEGASTQVNGFTLKGPGTVWREWEYMEGSVCVFGWDGNTNASAFSKEEVALDYELTEVKLEINKSPKEGPTIMDMDQFKKDHAELFAQVFKMGEDQAKASFTAKETEFTNTIAGLNTQLTASQSQIQELVKKDALRTERELFALSESVWTRKLMSSNIPERMFSKVKANLNYSKFVKDDILDEAAFSTAIDNELKDWEEFTKPIESVQGTGFSRKNVEGAPNFTEDNKKRADDLFALSGYAGK